MKRSIRLVVVMALLVLALAVPAFAASDNASCVGQIASGQNGLQTVDISEPAGGPSTGTANLRGGSGGPGGGGGGNCTYYRSDSLQTSGNGSLCPK